MVIAAMKFQDPCSWKESYDKPTDDSKKQGHHFADKGLYGQSHGFPIVMHRYECQTIKKAEC